MFLLDILTNLYRVLTKNSASKINFKQLLVTSGTTATTILGQQLNSHYYCHSATFIFLNIALYPKLSKFWVKRCRFLMLNIFVISNKGKFRKKYTRNVRYTVLHYLVNLKLFKFKIVFYLKPL